MQQFFQLIGRTCLLVLVLTGAPGASFAATEVKVGLYLTNLYDIDMHNSQYNVQFWVWFLHDNPDYDPTSRTEVINGKSWSQQNGVREVSGGQIWDVMSFRALIDEEWDIKRYPFDTQTLHIHLEDIEQTAANLTFIPDVAGTRIDESLIPDGWKLQDYRIDVSPHRYNTSFGDPALGSETTSEFSRVSLVMTLEREGRRLFTTIFIGFFVATLFVLMTLAVNMSRRAHPVIPLQPRVTLASGAIFSTIGSIYLLVNQMPYTTEFTLADSLLTTTSVGTVLCIVSSFTTDVVCKTDRAATMYRLNKVFFALFLGLHLGINTSFMMGWV
jgi:hypothetical protein